MFALVTANIRLNTQYVQTRSSSNQLKFAVPGKKKKKNEREDIQGSPHDHDKLDI